MNDVDQRAEKDSALIEELVKAARLVDEIGKTEERDGDDALWTDQFREMFEAAREALSRAKEAGYG